MLIKGEGETRDQVNSSSDFDTPKEKYIYKLNSFSFYGMYIISFL